MTNFFLYGVFLFPTLFTIYAFYQMPPELLPILLIGFRLLSLRIESEDISRIEHKIDTIFYSLPETKLKNNFERIHSTSWEHDGVIDISEEDAQIGLKRNNALSAIQIVNASVFYILCLTWLLNTLF